MGKFKKKLLLKMRRFFKDICEELLEDHKVNIYLVEKGDIIGKKMSVPFIPSAGSIIEIDETQNLFEVDKVYISNAFGVIHLYGHKIPYMLYIQRGTV
ncbi:hypothetical protein [Sinomicrobium weinanense]|uniref:Uncharacterized protein n=1 Tax=Sinomicrobium weinanense TaxID=2842200 RepID=A0A926Q5L1_9FLAO|nr:hypothetical protein [Sinomicrobium weinanense]MBC9798281.1 hypothetical protein [Sinomicrobium weinanense]MBU3125091.1 hypothetical protein [Sinomicrobium weinanense]